MYPRDAITYVNQITGNVTQVAVATSTNTILGIRLQQSGVASQTEVHCGTTSIVVNYGKDFSQVNMHYVCIDKPIYISKTGNDSSYYAITYVPRDRTTTFDPVTSTTTMGTTTINVPPITQAVDTIDYIYLIIVTVGILLYIFKK